MKMLNLALPSLSGLFLLVTSDFVYATKAEDIRAELDKINEAVQKAPFFGVSDDSVVAGYWQALERLGRIVTPELLKELSSKLDPTEAEFLNVAAALKDGADRVETLSLWYGRAQSQVPRALRKVDNDEQWSQMQRFFKLKRVTQIEPLHDEHAGEVYRPAWEAWLLSPATMEKNTLLGTAQQAIAGLGNPQSLPLLVTAFKDAVRDRDMSYPSPVRDTQCWGLIYTIHSFKTEAALLALLECRAVAVKAGLGRGTAIYHAQDKSFDESFIRLMTSTRHDSEAPPFNDLWKAYLPHIEAQLKRNDLPVPTRELLTRIVRPLRLR